MSFERQEVGLQISQMSEEKRKEILKTSRWAEWIGIASFSVSMAIVLLPRIPIALKLAAFSTSVAAGQNDLNKRELAWEIMDRKPGIEE